MYVYIRTSTLCKIEGLSGKGDKCNFSTFVNDCLVQSLSEQADVNSYRYSCTITEPAEATKLSIGHEMEAYYQRIEQSLTLYLHSKL